MFIGVDIGTSSTKAILIGENEADHTVARRYSMTHSDTGRAEIDPFTVRDAVFACLTELAAIARSKGGKVRAIAMAVSGNEATALDSFGEPILPTIGSMDTRGVTELGTFTHTFGSERIRQRTGLMPHVMHPLSRLLWMRENEPAAFSQTAAFLCWGDLAASWLGVTPAIDYSMASWSMAFDPRTRSWDQKLLSAANLPADVFPNAVPTGSVLGTIPQTIADKIGLGPDVRLVAGGFDQAMTAAGMGCLTSGTTAISAGTWEAVLHVHDSYSDHETARLSGFTTGCYVQPELYYTVANNPGGSAVVSWALQTFGQDEIRECKGDLGSAAALLIARANQEPTQLLVTPHHAGAYNPWMNSGAQGSIYGLSLSTTREEIIKAILQGITYELRANVDRLAQNAHIGKIVVGGGGARSPEWMQLRADVLNRELTVVSTEEPGALAAAAIAAAATDPSLTVNDIVDHRLGERITYAPRPQIVNQYDDLFGQYEPFYRALAQFQNT